MSTISVEVDIDDIILELGSSEKRNLLKELLNDMDDQDIIKSIATTDKKQNVQTLYLDTGSLVQDEFMMALVGIQQSYMKISPEDTTTIINIAKKYN
jgi:hypothetical protein